MQMEQLGTSTRTEVLSFGLVDFEDAPREWATKDALRVQRLRYGFGYPLALIETYLPARLIGVLDEDALVDASLHSLLRSQAGIELEKSRRTIAAVPASLEVGAALRAEVGTPVLLLKGITTSKEGELVEVFSTFHRGDRVEFDVETTI
ncbi:UTRA domain-containing protein [Luteococcus sp. H138]|uniref:GntR family transcriptional regulator n=1 Tax=unclassified Luteococcus TaxID=2639923 RepID=UPI00313D38D4